MRDNESENKTVLLTGANTLKITGRHFSVSIFDGNEEASVLDLSSFNKNEISFGRDLSNDIVLKSKLASRNHGKFKLVDDKCYVIDQKSTNGLSINGKKIDNYLLEDNDKIQIDNPEKPSEKGVLILFGAVDGHFEWKTLEVDNRSKITIGRDLSCDIRLDHMSVSKLHATIEKNNGEYFLVDHNSTNGTSISGKKVIGKVKLKEKDLILITNSKLTFTKSRISYYCFTSGFGLETVDLVKEVRVKRKSKTICNKISIKIEPCEFVAIVGGSGAGKSTLLNCISGYSQPTSGSAIVNGEDLFANYDAIKSIIGYVPQQDIVYDNLTLLDMLKYSARIRMPEDTSMSDRIERIKSVISTVELEGHENTFIKKLSGGQKKRASIAVELLSDPNLFFLDEPTSGLDPGTERTLMHTMQKMSRAGKTIILVTHNTLNLHLCDRIIFLGSGGNLCFSGSYEQALTFFGVDNLVNAYNLVSENTDEWKEKYSDSQFNNVSNNQFIPNHKKSGLLLKNNFKFIPKAFRQALVLSKLYLHLMVNDRQRILLLTIQPIILVLLIAFVKDDQVFNQYEMTKSVLFALACAAFWIGIMNTIQEVCKERNILKREYMTGLIIGAYVSSKFVVFMLLSALQALLLLITFSIVIGNPESGIISHHFVDMYLTTFLSIFAASIIGLLVSSFFKNADRAMTVAPLLVLPQILFSGIIFSLSGIAEWISYLAVCKWTMSSYGAIADLNELPMKIEQEGLIQFIRESEAIFNRSVDNLVFSWLILLAFILGFALLSMFFLRSIKND